MQKLPSRFYRAPAVVGSFCLILATLVTGCASKNPLMDDAAPVAAKAKPAKSAATTAAPVQVPEEKTTPVTSVTAEAPQATAPAAAVTETPVAAPAATSGATGVQTKRTKRFLGIFSPYRPDIQQGNFVSQEMVAQLKQGMTQDQVIFLLGTPLLNDLFHADRWDYAFRLQKGNGEITTSRVTVFFKDKLVSHFEGGDLPTEKDYLDRISDKAKEAGK